MCCTLTPSSGLAGRLALVAAVKGWFVAEGGRGRLQRVAGGEGDAPNTVEKAGEFPPFVLCRDFWLRAVVSESCSAGRASVRKPRRAIGAALFLCERGLRLRVGRQPARRRRLDGVLR
jgi:hypothetical protein